MSNFRISPMTSEQALKIITWRYDPPYGNYDLEPEDLNGLLNPVYRYHHVLDQEGGMVGYCCFGLDAQVPGGDYGRGEPEVLDVGVGMAPKFTGQGWGAGFVGAILEFALEAYRPVFFRVTVADFNKRSLHTFRKLGFEVTGHFIRENGKMPFTQLDRKAHE